MCGSGSTFLQNSAADGAGGAISSPDTAVVSFAQSVFTQNNAAFGGAFYLNASSAMAWQSFCGEMKASEASGNMAARAGGLAYFKSSSQAPPQCILQMLGPMHNTQPGRVAEYGYGAVFASRPVALKLLSAQDITESVDTSAVIQAFPGEPLFVDIGLQDFFGQNCGSTLPQELDIALNSTDCSSSSMLNIYTAFFNSTGVISFRGPGALKLTQASDSCPLSIVFSTTAHQHRDSGDSESELVRQLVIDVQVQHWCPSGYVPCCVLPDRGARLIDLFGAVVLSCRVLCFVVVVVSSAFFVQVWPMQLCRQLMWLHEHEPCPTQFPLSHVPPRPIQLQEQRYL